MRNIFQLLFLSCLLGTLLGCSSPSLQPTIVATVNGEPITLTELEVRHAVLFPGVSKDTENETETLQEQYAYTLRTLIQERIVEEYCHKKKIFLPKGELERREAELMGSYTEEAFLQILQEEGVTLKEWRKRLEKQLLVNYFYYHILRENISVTPDEVLTYYQKNRQAWWVPEQWHFLQFSDIDKGVVETAQKSFLSSRNATEAWQGTVSVREITMGRDRLPVDIVKEIQNTKPFEFSKIKKVGNQYRTFVLLEKHKARELTAAEAYERVEPVLIEEKLQSVYTAWLEKRLSKSTVVIDKAFLESYAQKEVSSPPAE